jgi:hypothetical protein
MPSPGAIRPIIRINPLILLSIYGFILLGLIVVALDTFVFNNAIKLNGPKDPHDYLWFTILFTLPHIIASFFGFFDKEYVERYGKKLLRGAQYITLAVIVLMLINIEFTFLIFALYTMTHVFLQQSGIAKSLMRGANKWHRSWQWSGVLISFLLYVQIYSDLVEIDRETLLPWLITASIVYLFLAFRSASASKSRIGTLYFWATVMVPIISGLFLVLGYPVLVIAIPRIIHDATAYMFYISHDHNRFVQSASNYIYSATSKVGLPVVVASPLLSIALAFPLQAGGFGNAVLPLLMTITTFHYYIEGFMWRRDSLHRKQIHYSSPSIDLL